MASTIPTHVIEGIFLKIRHTTRDDIDVVTDGQLAETVTDFFGTSNARIFDFTIDQEDMDLLDTLNQNYHSSSIPEDLRDIVF